MILPLLFNSFGDDRNLYVVAIDLLGHGKSDHKNYRGSYGTVDYLPDIISLVDTFGEGVDDASYKWEQFIIMGHSLGGGLATLIAGLIPDRVTGLIAIEAFGPWGTIRDDDFSALFTKTVKDNTKSMNLGSAIFPTFESAATRRAASPIGKMTIESSRLLCERGTKRVEGDDEKVVFVHDPQLKCGSLLKLTQGQVLATVQRMTCKTLVLWADQGYYFSEHKAADDKCHVKHISERLQVVSDKNLLTEVKVEGLHHMHMDNPEPVSAAIYSFLRSL